MADETERDKVWCPECGTASVVRGNTARIFADIAAECERRAASGRVPSAVFFGAVEGCPRADLVGGAAMLIAQIEALDREASNG